MLLPGQSDRLSASAAVFAGSAFSAETTSTQSSLSERTLKALRDVGYESPSPIQEQAIPPLLEGRDVIGQAQTGIGQDGGVRAADAAVRRPLRATRSRRSC